MKRLIFPALFLILTVGILGYSLSGGKEADEPSIYSVKYQELKRGVLKELGEWVTLYRQSMLGGDSAFYALKNAKVYADEALEKELETNLAHKSEVIVDLPKSLNKEELKDANSEGDGLIYKVISIDGRSVEGYMVSSDLFSERYDFISYPEENVSYKPFPKKVYKNNPPIKVRGVYVTLSSAANGAGNLDYLIDLARTSDINTFVIDVKDDNGSLLFKSKAAERYMPSLNEQVAVDNIEALIKRLKKEDIYLVARIVTFKSPNYAKKYPDRAIVYRDTGELFMSGDGLRWASPHDRKLWDYNISIAEEAAELGFNEIQFDYVRFPDVSAQTNVRLNFRNDKKETKTEAIHNFLTEAYGRLSKKEVYVTADFFGFVATAVNDQFIGQHWESVCNVVDYAAPMVYPSHYGSGNFGLSVPDAHPYECIDGAMKDALDRNKNLYTPAKLRPWIQDFTAPWVKGHIRYGKAEVMAQIKALKDNGIDEYMLWNAGNKYTAEALHNDGRE